VTDPSVEQQRWLRSHPLVFVDDLDAPIMSDDDYHHLSRSLRLKDGAAISISDGRGRWRSGRLGPVVEVTGPVIESERRSSPITVAFAPVKAQRPEWIVQKLTELGVDHIIPLRTERSVVRWDQDRAGRQQERWAKTIREAAMQSRHVRLPTFDSVSDVRTVLARHPEACLADPDGPPVEEGDRMLLVGPEGGWGADEAGGAALRSLPGGILRAETACIVAATMLVNARNSPPFTLGG
jgi:16S rRNA (uracil1498-N3)-methyltransferase